MQGNINFPYINTSEGAMASKYKFGLLKDLPVLSYTSNDRDIEGSKWNNATPQQFLYITEPSMRFLATDWSRRQEARWGSCNGGSSSILYHFNKNVQFEPW